MAANNKSTDEVSIYYGVQQSEIIRVALTGIAAGILIPLVGWAISHWVIDPVFCQGDSQAALCQNSSMIGYYVASVIVAIALGIMLTSWGIFRAIMIVIGATVALWGLQKYIGPLSAHSWLEYGLASAVAFGAAYVLFYWLMRLKNFVLGLVLALVAIVVARWVLLA